MATQKLDNLTNSNRSAFDATAETAAVSRRMVVVYGGVVLALMGISLANHGFNGDVLMDINIGQWILLHGHVPMHNYFTQALYGRPFSDTEWGFSLWVAWAYAVGGRIGVYLSLVPFLAVVAGFVGYWTSKAERSWVGLVVLLMGLGMMITANPRPQLMSYAGFAFGLFAVQRARRGRWGALAAFLAVIPVWTNMHSSVALAPALLFNEVLWTHGTNRWRMVAATGASVLLMLLRVGGAAAGGAFVAHVFSGGVVNVIGEWQSPNFHTATGLVLLPLIILAWTVLLPKAWRHRSWATVVWLIAAPVAALWAIRFAPYMILGIAATLPELTTPEPRVRRGWRRAAAGGMLALNALWFGSALHPSFFAPNYPLSALSYLQRQHARGVVTFQSWSDAAEFAHLRPWTNGQAQMWAMTPWWIPFVQAQTGGTAIVPWVDRWDPKARWILWPISGFGPAYDAIQAPGWRLVYRANLGSGEVGVWHRGRSS